MFLDFYGQNICRLFQDPNGGIVRDPQAKPEAQILVAQPRRDVSMTVSGNVISTKNGRLTLTVSSGDGAVTVKAKNGKKNGRLNNDCR